MWAAGTAIAPPWVDCPKSYARSLGCQYALGTKEPSVAERVGNGGGAIAAWSVVRRRDAFRARSDSLSEDGVGVEDVDGLMTFLQSL